MLRVLVVRDSSTAQTFVNCDCCEFETVPDLRQAAQALSRGNYNVLLVDYKVLAGRLADINSLLTRPIAAFIFNASEEALHVTYIRNKVSDIIREFPKNLEVGHCIEEMWEQHVSRSLDRVLSAASSTANAFAVQI